MVQVDDSQKDTQLVAHLIHTEAPVFIVVASSLYRALTVAAAGSHISLWYPRIVKKVLAEVQEGLHGFIRWLNSKTTEVSASCGRTRTTVAALMCLPCAHWLCVCLCVACGV